jgi:peptidoglycan/LPS O-acetylase OafA/YrhL
MSQEEWANGIYRVVLFRPDSIALGLAAAALSRSHPAVWSRLRSSAAIAGVAVLAGVLAYMAWGDPEHSAAARVFLLLVMSVGCVLLLPWGSTCTCLGGRAVEAPVRAMARWSYSMYLLNLMLSSTVLSHMQFHYGTAVGVLSYASACVAGSAALYHGFEAPLLRWRDRRFPMGAA